MAGSYNLFAREQFLRVAHDPSISIHTSDKSE